MSERITMKKTLKKGRFFGRQRDKVMLGLFILIMSINITLTYWSTHFKVLSNLMVVMPEKDPHIKEISQEDQGFADIGNCLQNDGPLPVILISRGRSGSSSTWQMMSKLTGKETPSHEYTGKDTIQSRRFFEAIDPNDGGKWLMDYLCERQIHDNDAGIVGFKWKPFLSIYSNPAMAALKLIAGRSKNEKYMPIRVVRSRRNPLDVYLSTLKHRMPMRTQAHCLKGDIKCVEQHKEVTITVPDVDNLYKYLRDVVDKEDVVDNMLEELGIPTIFVNYDNLYFPKTPQEGVNSWNKILSFLGNIGPVGKFNLSWYNITNAMGHEPTSVQRHMDKIANFDEVDAALRETDLSHLIHR